MTNTYSNQWRVNQAMENRTAVTSMRILVVDDNVLATLVMKNALQKYPDCEVVTAFNGEQALQLFEQKPFDVLITDYQMPGLDGLALAARIHRLHPQTAIVMISGYHHIDTLREWAAVASIRHILPKPVSPSKIYDIVSTMLDKY